MIIEKIKLLKFTALIILLPFLGFTQKIEIIDSNVVQEYKDINFETLKTSSHLYVIQDKYEMNVPMDRNVQVDVYDNDLNNVGSSLVDDKTLSGEEPNIFEGFHVIGDKLYLFKSNYNMSKKEHELFYYPISTSGEKGKGSMLTSFSSEKAMNAGNFHLNVSPDGSKIGVFIEMPFERKEDERCIVQVYDKNFSELWQKDYEFPYRSVRGPKNELFINNQGITFVVKTPDVKKQLDFHTVFTFLDNGSEVVESLFEMSSDLVMSTFKSNFSENDDLILSGFYYTDKKFGVNVSAPNGLFYVKLNSADGSIAVQKSEEMKGNLQDLKAVSALLVNGDEVILTAERIVEDKKAQNPGSTEVEYDFEYKNERVMMFYITSAGAIKWQETVKRNANSMNDGGKTNNTFTWIGDNEIHVLFRDHKYKHDGTDSKVIGPSKASIYVPVIFSFNIETGEKSSNYIKHKRIGDKFGTFRLILGTGYKIDANNCFMIAAENDSRRKLVSTKVSL
ncbi:MAG: hypothetical protein WEA99_07985 [Brumimicrobium sp.]